MRAWSIIGVVVGVVVLSAACKQKECPAPPACPKCPEPSAVDAPGPEEYAGYEFRLVEKDGKVGFVATSSKGRVVVIPLDPTTRMFADGKEGTAGEMLAFAPSTGGCPCIMPRCWPYCRVAEPVLNLEATLFWGRPDYPRWPSTALETPAPGDPKAPVPAPAPAPPQ